MPQPARTSFWNYLPDILDTVNTEIVGLLLEAGVDLGPDTNGTILHDLMNTNRYDLYNEAFEPVLDMLLNAGADPRTQDSFGFTAADLLRRYCEDEEEFSITHELYPAYVKLLGRQL